MLALLGDGGNEVQPRGDVCRSGGGPMSTLWSLTRQRGTHGAPPLSGTPTTPTWPSRTPAQASLSAGDAGRGRQTRLTQPFSMTQLNARTISSIGTGGACVLATRLCAKMQASEYARTGLVGTVGEEDVDVVQPETLERSFCALDDAGNHALYDMRRRSRGARRTVPTACATGPCRWALCACRRRSWW